MGGGKMQMWKWDKDAKKLDIEYPPSASYDYQ